MKKLVFALCMFFGAVVVVNAQDTTSTPSPTDPTSTTPPAASTQEQGRVKIKSQELPDAVKSSLESQEYRGWLVNSAYKVDATSTTDPNADPNAPAGNPSDTTDVSGNTGDTGANMQEVYIVELKNGAQTKTVRFDKDGKKLDDEGMEDDQK
jgi:hypothetical protein